MREEPLVLTFRGVRGTATTPGPGTLRHGGHTACLDLACTPAHRLVLDCGSGLRALEADLPPEPGPEGFRFDVFLTHYHFDHLEGLRLFQPLYDRRSRFVFHGPRSNEIGVRQALEGSMTPPWFPVRLNETVSRKEFVDLDGAPLWVEDVRVSAAPVAHPQGALGYRLERGGRAIVFITDSETADAAAEAASSSLARGADVLIHDAQYTPEEYERRYRTWGHSSWKHAVQIARAAGVGRLVLFHHDPARTDDELDAIVAEARREFPAVEAAREGMTVGL